MLAAAVIFLATGAVLAVGLRSGAWIYLLVVPALYFVFRSTRRKMGSPNPLQDELGRREQAMHNLGMPQSGDRLKARIPTPALEPADEASARGRTPRWTGDAAAIQQVAVALDGSAFSEAALPVAERIARMFDATLVLLTVLPALRRCAFCQKGAAPAIHWRPAKSRPSCISTIWPEPIERQGYALSITWPQGPVAQAIETMVSELDADLLVMSTHGRSGVGRFMLGSNASAALQVSSRPDTAFSDLRQPPAPHRRYARCWYHWTVPGLPSAFCRGCRTWQQWSIVNSSFWPCRKCRNLPCTARWPRPWMTCATRRGQLATLSDAVDGTIDRPGAASSSGGWRFPPSDDDS